MYRYVLAFLLVSTYSGSHGVSVPLPLSVLLSSLTTSCPNVFLTGQINGQQNVCNVYVPPYNEQQFVCMMFYDINKQLCKATRDSKLTLSGDYIDRINANLDVEDACAEAKNWSVTDLAELPTYKDKVKKVFDNKIFCVKVCGVVDVTSQETNFFCKYLKWGSEMLSSLSTPAPIMKDENPPPKDDNSNLTNGIENNGQVLPSGDQIMPLVVKHETTQFHENTTLETNNDIVPSSQEKNVSVVNQSIAKTKELLTKTSGMPLPSQQGQSLQQELMDIKLGVLSVPSTEKVLVSPSEAPSHEVIDRPVDEKVPKEDDDNGTVEEPEKNAPQQKEGKISSENTKVLDAHDTADYSEEDGADVDENADVDGEVDKPESIQEIKSIPKNFETPFVGEESYANAMPDQYATDDDHFFSFFLTAVIMVVLLYVLYHNKSKVSKVVLGLIVEGRQPGRRRNSRGHAYKRLDTLEQAMSTSSTAPPSKIIY